MMTKISSEGGVSTSGQSKLLGLELVRFTCAMAVLIWHFHHFAMVGDGAAMYGPHMPLGMLLYPFYHFGLFGVQVFWCISGFIFYWKYARAIASRRIEPKRFFWLRFSRLYPLHFVTLLIVAALQPVYAALAGHPFVFMENGVVRFLLQLLLADQWGGSHAMSFNGPIWSVSAEVFVYVGFFLMLRSFGRSPWLIVGAVAAGLTSLWTGAISPALVCGAYFFAGGAAAEWLASERARQRPGESRAAAVAIIALLAMAAPFLDLGNEDSDRLATWLMAAVPPLLFLAAQEWRALERFERPIQAAGNLTYSTYLTHFPLQLTIAIIALATGIKLPVDEAWFLIAYLGMTIVIGRIVFIRFEAPIQTLIRDATLTPSRAAAAT